MSLKPIVFFALVAACGGAPAAQNPNTTHTTQAELGPAPGDDAARLSWAIDGPQRSAADKARDAARHPKETLAFFGVTDKSHVIELWPGGGWYTEILAPYLRDDGKLTVTNFDPAKAQGEQKEFAESFDKKLSSAPSVYGKVEVRRIAPPEDLSLGPDGSADVVLTFRNLHGWINNGYEKKVFEAAFKALKPGGVFGICEHRANPGVDPKTSAKTGYIPEQSVIDLAQSVGFKLGGKSEINANPKDDHNHDNGVWSLAPTFRGGDKDRAKYGAIGESDRMTLKFVKP
ncbi:MAG TPA: hypothetical protein VGH28_17045 [Polyangiaceae bacterium]|jgi:predicted methyltransferase